MANPTLHRLIARGDYVALEKGHLIIKPGSGKIIPTDWLASHRTEILQQIAEVTGQPIFQYLNYSTGRYSNHISPGVLLNYVNIHTGQTSPVVFNAKLTRERTSKAGKNGTDLPKGQFKPGRSFCAFWTGLALPNPRRQSEFYERMGKLKTVLVTGNYKANGHLDKATLKAADISHDTLRLAFGLADSTGNSPATFRQGVGNSPARVTGKEINQTQSQQGFQANSSACAKQCELSNQEGASKAMPLDNLSIGITPLNQSVEDWLNDYSSTPGRIAH